MTKIKPDPQDHEAVERENGRLRQNATDAERADRYRLAQAAKMIRLYGQERIKSGPRRA
jgi:hypothetical protein